jgi:hypothetical protein
MKNQSAASSRTRHLARAVAVLGLAGYALPGVAAPDWDIVGIRLGMTEQEARAAIQAHSEQAVSGDQMLKFTFSDGAKQQETPQFLATINVRIPGPPNTLDTEGMTLEFSAPPLEQRVIGVRRALSTYKNPPPLDRMHASLTQKYGQPLRDTTGGLGMKIRNLSWAEPGKAQCGGERFFFPGAKQSPSDLRKFYQYQQQQLAPADLSQCGAQMRVTMQYPEGGASVNTLVIEMNDYGYILPALEATAKWLADLEAEARRVRLGSGEVPRL